MELDVLLHRQKREMKKNFVCFVGNILRWSDIEESVEEIWELLL